MTILGNMPTWALIAVVWMVLGIVVGLAFGAIAGIDNDERREDNE